MNKFAIFIGIFAVSGSLFARSPLHAFDSDDRIENAFKKSSIIRTFLRKDVMKIESKDGSVTLTGTVSHGFHISLAQDTAENLPGVKSVDNRLTVSESDRTIAGEIDPAPTPRLCFAKNITGSWRRP